MAKIMLHVQGSYEDYTGNYSIVIPLAVEDEDSEDIDRFINDEPILIHENGNKCIWKNETWWIGNCEDLGQKTGFVSMSDCNCPWPM